MKSEILEVKQLTAAVSFWNEKYTLILENTICVKFI